MFQILNIMGETPWKINKKVLNVMENIWQEGGGFGEIPLRQYNFSDYIHPY